jgi:hypothetical protein
MRGYLPCEEIADMVKDPRIVDCEKAIEFWKRKVKLFAKKSADTTLDPDARRSAEFLRTALAERQQRSMR